MSDSHDLQRVQTIIEKIDIILEEKLPHIKSCALHVLTQ